MTIDPEQDIRAAPKLKVGQYKKIMGHNVLLQSHIAEADKANICSMLLIPSNIEDISWVLPRPERE